MTKNKRSFTRRNLNKKKPTKLHRQVGGNITDKIKEHMELLTTMINNKTITAPLFQTWKNGIRKIYAERRRKDIIPVELDEWIYKLTTEEIGMETLLFYKNKIKNVIDNLERANIGIETIPNIGVKGNSNYLKAKPDIVEHVKSVGVVMNSNAIDIKPDGKELEALVNKLFDLLYKTKRFSSISTEPFAEPLRKYLTEHTDLTEQYEPLHIFMGYRQNTVPVKQLLDSLSIVLTRPNYIPEAHIRLLQSQLQSSRHFMEMDETLLTFIKRDPMSVTREEFESILYHITPILQVTIKSIHNSIMKNMEPIGTITHGPILNNDE